MTISALVITKNEECNIQDCLVSVSWADEIVVVDSLSTDRTAEIARQVGAKVYQKAWSGYSAQKNYGSALCTSDWILSIDADERVTPELRDEIRRAAGTAEHAAYRIFVRDYMFGKWIEHGSWPQQCHVRLYRRGAGEWRAEVHESVAVNGSVGVLQERLLHYSHLTVARFIHKMNSYTDIEAERWYQQGVRKSWLVTVLSPLRIFFTEYFTRRGFLDRGHGFVLALLYSFYFFLARVKLWELWYKKDHGIS